MIFSLGVRRARKGDCLIVHYGSKNDPGLALIDGGPGQVYKPHLKPRLMQIRKARGLGNDESLSVDLLMVSHIDDDHINGILELTNELVVAKDAMKPLPLKVRSLWHNTFDDIIGNNPDELRAAVTASFGAAALSGEPDTEGLEPAAAMVLASVEQGVRLRDDARKLKLRICPEFDGQLVMATHDGKRVDMGKGLTLTVAGPMKPELVALQEEYNAWLKKDKEERKTKAALASFTDTSVPNLSSIVVLAEADKKRMLLTGDARGDKILEGLEMVDLLKPGGTLHIDVLKMPHHGSDRNMDRIFFQRITADHYVFSGNGEYGNPERETLQMLLDKRGDAEFTIHLTYPIQEIDVEREKNWNKEQQKEKSRKKNNPSLDVRENWSPKKHSLTAFFAAHQDFARKVSIVEEDVPHVINLLDAVGF
jgi:glyoxylase-like metal-dependent hydrolase (beta-lactamase superfamily II)